MLRDQGVRAFQVGDGLHAGRRRSERTYNAKAFGSPETAPQQQPSLNR
jgi:hypothetical protein